MVFPGSLLIALHFHPFLTFVRQKLSPFSTGPLCSGLASMCYKEASALYKTLNDFAEVTRLASGYLTGVEL